MIEFKENYYEDQKFNNLVIDKKEIQGITFQNCTFNNCSFRETIFRMCKFRECTFKEGDLSLIQVDGSTFSRTRFEDLKLIGVNWVMGSWGKKEIQQSLKSLDFENCVLNYSTFMGLTLQRSLIRKCIAKEVDFSDADLKLADCTYTNFENSRFSNTDLTEADLRGATNYFIVPHLNILKKTKFSLPDALSLLYNLDIIISDPSDDQS